ncbi:MAG: glycosyltransferase family 2 protein [Trichodesmium sp. MAG_R04]|nr:glycosyltransferase family 2 protein [Trichodesmium sp. MAG_R04]
MSKEMSVPHLKKVRLELDSYSQSLQYHRKYLQKIKAQLKKLSHFSVQKDQALETPRNKKLVHCVLLTFYFNEILERCLAGLLPEKNRIDVTVIENSSVHSDAIRKVVDSYREKGLVKNYFIFEENIGTNAFEIAFDSNLLDLDYEYITVTDGDLVPDKEWLDEQITILEKYPEVFSVSSDLYYNNAPHPVKTGVSKIAIESENEIYKERLAGWWLKTFRRKDWQDFVNYRKANNIYFHDRSAYDYGKIKKNMKSVLAKSFKSYHLTWDYVDQNYLKMKGSLKGKTHDPWYHARYSSFKLITIEDSEVSFPAPKEVTHQRIKI